MKFRLIIILSAVIVASGCVSDNSSYEESKINYTEAKEKSTEISYSNLLRYSERHRGTFIEQEGRIGQLFDGGLLLHTNLAIYDSFNRWKGHLVWVDRQNNFSIYKKGGYLKVFGEYRGTKTYEGKNGEYATVPRMGTSFVTNAVEVDVKVKASPSLPREDSKSVKVDKLCVGQSCKFDTNESKFRLKTNTTYQIRVNDSNFGNHSKELPVRPQTDSEFISVGNYYHSPAKVLDWYIRDIPYNLLSSEIRVSGKENTSENRQKQIEKLNSEYGKGDYWIERVNTRVESQTGNKAEVRAYIEFHDNSGKIGEVNKTYNLLKEKNGWKLEKALDPYSLEGETINLSIDSLEEKESEQNYEPIYPSNYEPN